MWHEDYVFELLTLGKIKFLLLFRLLIRTIEVCQPLNYSRSEIKIRFYFVFPSLIRNFAHDFMNMWIDLGCLQPQKKMLKEKTCWAYTGL